MKQRGIFSGLFILFAICPCVAYSTTIHVPQDQPTIQAGIISASVGDTILVAPGTYLETLHFDYKPITLQSEVGAGGTIIDGHSAGPILMFSRGEDEDTVVDGFTIRNGEADKGGGIYCVRASPTIKNCTVSLNVATNGGGIYCYDGSSPALVSCTISKNFSLHDGGGIYCYNHSFPTITDCMITGNTAQKGGGIRCRYSSSPTIANCVIVGNRADWNGGGISCYDSSSPVLTDCSIVENISDYGGGLYFLYGPTPRIRGCIISRNMAYGEGGGIYCREYSLSNVQNCLITENLSDFGGGIACKYESRCTLKNCTISENSAVVEGGGILCVASSLTLTNCILWADSSPQGAELSLPFSESGTPSTLTVEYSDVHGGEASVYIEEGSSQSWLEGNLEADPLFAGEGDYHILDGSPCIDAGTDVGVTEDMDGDPRPQGYGFDIGSDENLNCWDYDGDHSPDVACGGGDCDDQASHIHPAAAESCDGLDNNCDGIVDDRDIDEDGYVAVECAGTDCDDSDPLVYPGALERCDGVDDDCDGLIPSEERDEDQDGWIPCAGDCDDHDPEVNPDHPEVPDNGIDDDCDGEIDEPFSTIHVPADQPTLQAGIDAAFDGDVVLVAPGTYVERINFAKKFVTIRSEAGAGVTVIDGSHAGTVLTFTGDENDSILVEGFTIRNGEADLGGGVFCSFASPTIANCTITNNQATQSGGGFYCHTASPTIMNCTISANRSPSGGGIFCFSSCPQITNCTISENVADTSGGGLCCIRSSPTISNSTIEKNHSDQDGGGICCYDDSSPGILSCKILDNVADIGGAIACIASSPTIRLCTLADNSADSKGGGVFCLGSAASPAIASCVITGNSATYEGGGVCCYGHCSPEIVNCTIVRNLVTSGAYSRCFGGGMFCSSSSPTVTNCTFSRNIADGRGGAMACISSTPMMLNCILWGDIAFEAPEVYGSPSIAFSDIENGWEGEGNIDADPLFVGDGDYHLSLRSPCIDAGAESSVYSDIDGDERPQGQGWDMGSDEYPDCGDADADGFGDVSCGGYDCDDTNPLVYLGAEERCDNGIDDDCDGSIDSDDPECIFLRVPGDHPTLQDAIDAAEDGNRVLVAPGTYFETITIHAKAITLQSEAGFDVTVIDGRQDGSVVTITNVEAPGSVIDGFTITNGSGTHIEKAPLSGGGIYCSSSSPTVTQCRFLENSAYLGGGIFFSDRSHPSILNCTFVNNSAGDGGGLYTTYSYPMIQSCTIAENSATSGGGGMYCYYSSSTIRDCTILENDAQRYGGGIMISSSNTTIDRCTVIGNAAEGGSSSSGGGGIYCNAFTSTITDCLIQGNSSDLYGGGIFCKYSASPTIEGCTIADNNAYSGGGIYCYYYSSPTIADCWIMLNSAHEGGGIQCYDNSSPRITRCTVSENCVGGDGGGIFCEFYSSPTITDCTISANNATLGGGIRCYSESNPMISNCMITENSAMGSGGGLFCSLYSHMMITNCTIARNEAWTSGGGIHCLCSSFAILTNCIFWGDSAPQGPELAIGKECFIVVKSSDVQWGPWAVHDEGPLLWALGNKNSNPQFVGLGDYHLRPVSPCIDAGRAVEIDTDIDGDPRPYGDGYDMGADEYVPGHCQARIVPIFCGPIAFYLIPALILIFFSRSLFGKMSINFCSESSHI